MDHPDSRLSGVHNVGRLRSRGGAHDSRSEMVRNLYGRKHDWQIRLGTRRRVATNLRELGPNLRRLAPLTHEPESRRLTPTRRTT